MKWPTMDEFAQMVADKALDEVEYNGKTIREWTEIILANASEDTISRRAAIKEMFEHFGANSIEDIPLQQYWNPAHVIRVLEESPTVTYTKINPPSDYARQFGLFPKEDATDINVATKDGTNLAEVGTDCISRQAAIDAFYLYPNINWTTLDVLKKINEMPTIQPKRETATVSVGTSKGGITMWYECAACGEPVDQGDTFCSGCGRRLIHE